MEWQPIDTAPKDETVLVAAQGWSMPVFAEWRWNSAIRAECWCSPEGDRYTGDFAPTVWMPLPEPPKP